MKPDFTLLGAPAKRMLAWLGFCSVLKAVSLIAFAYYLSWAIVDVIQKKPFEHQLWMAVGAALLRALCQWAITVASAYTASGIKAEIQSKLLRKALYLPKSSEHSVAEINTLATTGLSTLDNYFTQFFPALVATATIPWILMLWIGYWDWMSALIIFFTIGLVPFFMVLIGLHTEDATSQARKQLVTISHQLIELAQGLPVIIGLAKVQQQGRAFKKILEKYRTKTLEVLRISFMSSLALELIATISVALVAVVIGVRLVYGHMSLEVALMVLILAPECYLPLREIGAGHHASEDGVDTLKASRAILEEKDALEIPLKKSNDVLSFHDFQCGFPKQSWLGQALTATLPPHSISALTGASGTGKSTLLGLVAGLYSTDDIRTRGYFAGVPREDMVYVPQQPHFYAETVAEEILLYDSQADVEETLATVGLEHIENIHPSNLSPGEQRRIALARTIVPVLRGNNPAQLVMIDEPTAHLDYSHAQLIRQLISQLSNVTTVLLVSHEPETLALAQHHLKLASTGVVEQQYVSSDVEDFAPRVKETQLDESSQEMSVPSLLKELGLNSRLYWFSILLGIFAAGAAIALSSVSAWLIVRASEHPPIMYLTVAIVGVRFFGIARAACRYFERLLMHDALFSSMEKLRSNMWQNLAQQGLSSRQALNSSHVVRIIIEQADQLRDIIPRAINPLIASWAAGVATVVVLTVIQPSSFVWFASLTIVGLLIIPRIASGLEQQNAKRTMDLKAQRVFETSSFLLAKDDLKANHRAENALKNVDSLNSEEATLNQKLSWKQGFSTMLSIALTWTVSALILLQANSWHLQGMSSGMVAVCALTPLAMTEIFLIVNSAQVNYGNLKKLLDSIGQYLKKPTARNKLSVPGSVQHILMSQLAAKWQGQQHYAIENINFSLPDQESSWLSVVGPSGSGKSTLLSVIMGFLPYEKGSYTIEIAGKSYEAQTVDLTGKIAWCPQESHIFNSTLRGNLMLGADSPRSDAELEEVLHRVGFTRELTQGLDTQVGTGGAFLSGGERQRLAVARTLLSQAHVVLLDEPTAHLDQEAAQHLMHDLRQGLQDRIVVLITHHQQDITQTDAVLKL
ncbi:MAG: thiol reductant ABC exporter subunit CydC [Micrococcaceae bacterium]